MESLFKIKAQQLLVAAEDPQFGDGRKIGNRHEITLHTDRGQLITQRCRSFVLAGQPQQQ